MELRLWSYLRAGRLPLRVRRQEPIGPFIADFAIRRLRIVIEVDGWGHTLPQGGSDAARDRWFEERGWLVLRFTDTEVAASLDAVLDCIIDNVNARLEER